MYIVLEMLLKKWDKLGYNFSENGKTNFIGKEDGYLMMGESVVVVVAVVKRTL